MTKEDAIIQLRLGPGINEDVSEKYNDAVNMAIEALQDRPSGKWTNLYEDGHGFWCGTCDRCGKEGDVSMFCPNCGAYMRGDDDGSCD